MSSELELSVVIPSYNAKDTVVQCLASLEQQTTNARFEIIVVDSSSDGTADIVRDEFPNVEVLRFDERQYPGTARNAAIAIARSPLIVQIDADCVASSDWVDQVLAAHQGPGLAVGGAIGNANPESWVGWGGYFCEFSQWMPETAAGVTRDIAGANMSYKRSVFERFGDYLEGSYCSDTDLHWRLTRVGEKVRFVPSILVHHHNNEVFGSLLTHEFSHGRWFGSVRSVRKRFSMARRILYVAGTPLIPVKLFGQIVARNLKNPVYLSRFSVSWPLVALCVTAWSLGECVGYIRPRSGVDPKTV